MEHYKISQLSNDSIISKFAAKKWIEVNDLWSGQYSVYKNITFRTSVLRLDLWDYSDTYIVVKGTITVEGCISKISNTFIENAEDLDIVMPC